MMNFISVLYLVTAAGASFIPINVSHNVPHYASAAVNPSFLGFAFEETSFVYYGGNKTSPDIASRNLVQVIANKTQARPLIRVGGTSLDHGTFNASQKEAITIPPSEVGSGIPKGIQIGPSFFESFANFPTAQFMLDIPWAEQNLNNSIAFSRAAYRAIGKDRLFAFELGNEPNNYGRFKGGDKREKMESYAKEWAQWTDAIDDAVGVGSSSIWQGVVLSSETGGRTHFPGGTSKDWKIPDLFENGLEQYADRMKSVAMHYYQTQENPNTDIQADLLNHTAVVKGSEFIRKAVKYLRNPKRNIPVYLAEVGNTLGNGTKYIQLEGSLGSALWQIDFSLYAMSIGVTGVNIQCGTKFPFSLWRPNINHTHGEVLPAFYSHIFSAEFMGSSGNTRVTNIDLDSPFLSSYAAYENGSIARVAIINLRQSDGSLSENDAVRVALSVGDDVKTAEVKKLSSPNGAAATAETISFDGTQWVYEDPRTEKKVKKYTKSSLSINGGTVDLEVKSSEAVIVYLE
ncbi:uncharacterized protein N7496_006735 [Penicillium cataractarum]|uniref:Beta-glucuronidase C-terminal domain-containing protein n=1 Tax=Penicillium cataractarum TaxID=2100454 RepID=A0A9W9V6E9_9EURO|nr:uncharacterized protein N7496_006735 [Penicillium cataractarum]KAJ5370643.1 hypothetical protein N7496_006735 [Penicillium cataractarum]